VPPGLMAAAQRARPRPSLLLQGSVGRDGQGLSARSEKNGVWGKAIEVPGLSSLNRGGNATVNSVSCASPSSCTAGGSFTDRSRFSRFQGFVT
jgi:hypothetical protein